MRISVNFFILFPLSFRYFFHFQVNFQRFFRIVYLIFDRLFFHFSINFRQFIFHNFWSIYSIFLQFSVDILPYFQWFLINFQFSAFYTNFCQFLPKFLVIFKDFFSYFCPIFKITRDNSLHYCFLRVIPNNYKFFTDRPKNEPC